MRVKESPQNSKKITMKNLAGETKADLYVLEELEKSGIEIIEGERSKGEVPCTLTGKLGDWNFSRAWYYWMANAQNGKGLPLEVAAELHERPYPITGEDQPKIYGQVVRVAGNCGCPHPREWAFPSDNDMKRLCLSGVTYGDLAKQCNAGIIQAPRYVKNYHVDNQEGLNVLADSIRKLHKITSGGTSPEEIKRLRDKFSSLFSNWESFQKQDGIEWYKKLPTIVYDDRTVTELIVAIQYDNQVVSIAKKWRDNKSGREGIAQHFFEGGQITGFNYGNISGPGQILNRGPEIDEKLRPHYEEIKALRPIAGFTLELCMRKLEKPGPQYGK